MSNARRTSVILAIIAALLAGCADREPVKRRTRAAWRGKVEAACLKLGKVHAAAYVRPLAPISGPGTCGARRPLRISATSGGDVALTPSATLACPMVPVVERWVASDVQSKAIAFFGEPVRTIEVAASYGCRTRNGQRGAPMSEHAYANALDVSAFRLASGRRVSVEGGWRGSLDESLFLRAVHEDACRRFKTVIGPDGDRHHQDHLHLDLAWHGKDGLSHFCQ